MESLVIQWEKHPQRHGNYTEITVWTCALIAARYPAVQLSPYRCVHGKGNIFFLFCKTSKVTLGHIKPPIWWVIWTISSAVNWPAWKLKLLFHSSICLHGTHRHDFTFTPSKHCRAPISFPHTLHTKFVLQIFK